MAVKHVKIKLRNNYFYNRYALINLNNGNIIRFESIMLFRGFNGLIYLKYKDLLDISFQYKFRNIALEDDCDEYFQVVNKSITQPTIYIEKSEINEFLVQARIGNVVINNILL